MLIFVSDSSKPHASIILNLFLFSILQNFAFVPNLSKLVFSISELLREFCHKSLTFWKYHVKVTADKGLDLKLPIY